MKICSGSNLRPFTEIYYAHNHIIASIKNFSIQHIFQLLMILVINKDRAFHIQYSNIRFYLNDLGGIITDLKANVYKFSSLLILYL